MTTDSKRRIAILIILIAPFVCSLALMDVIGGGINFFIWAALMTLSIIRASKISNTHRAIETTSWIDRSKLIPDYKFTKMLIDDDSAMLFGFKSMWYTTDLFSIGDKEICSTKLATAYKFDYRYLLEEVYTVYNTIAVLSRISMTKNDLEEALSYSERENIKRIIRCSTTEGNPIQAALVIAGEGVSSYSILYIGDPNHRYRDIEIHNPTCRDMVFFYAVAFGVIYDETTSRLYHDIAKDGYQVLLDNYKDNKFVTHIIRDFNG